MASYEQSNHVSIYTGLHQTDRHFFAVIPEYQILNRELYMVAYQTSSSSLTEEKMLFHPGWNYLLYHCGGQN